MKVIGLFFSFVLLMLTLTPLAEDTSKSKWFPDDAELPLRFGVGIDFFAMDQPYSIQSLAFSLPGMEIPVVDTSAIGVQNEIQHMDIKLDAWVLPYLNLFAILGKVDGTTTVDFTAAGLPLPMTTLNIDIDGNVYGAGATLAIANDRYFGSLTTTYTTTNLKGGFDSSLKTVSVQPRAGIYTKNYQLWLGGLYLNTDERHMGAIPLSLGGPDPTLVNFDVTLEDKQSLSPVIGGTYHFNKHFGVTVEGGLGDRKPLLVNLTYRIQ